MHLCGNLLIADTVTRFYSEHLTVFGTTEYDSLSLHRTCNVKQKKKSGPVVLMMFDCDRLHIALSHFVSSCKLPCTLSGSCHFVFTHFRYLFPHYNQKEFQWPSSQLGILYFTLHDVYVINTHNFINSRNSILRSGYSKEMKLVCEIPTVLFTCLWFIQRWLQQFRLQC